MAGMFYSLEQTREKLGKNDAEIKALVREGKLREFRDGAKQLYKTEDVDALASVPKGDTAVLDDSMQLAIDETGEISLAPEELSMLMGDGDEKDAKNESKFKLDETGALMADEVLDQDDAKDGDFNLDIAAQDTKINQKSKSSSKSGSKASSKLPADLDEPLSNADTNISISGDSINVLSGSTENEFNISDDTLGETKLVQKPSKALDDKSDDAMSVAKLDDDVNLDSFGGGSGSGLLDLSLQADDTSLGAVLDDIYPETQNAPASKQGTPGGGLAAEAEKIFEQESPESIGQEDLGQAAPTAAESAMVMMMAEPAPDAASNMFGVILFVPMLVAIYTAIVVAAGYNSIPSLQILSSIEPFIWYAAGGLAAVVILMALVASTSGKEKKAKKPKPPKQPKVVQPKPKKEKKAKKGAPNA